MHRKEFTSELVRRTGLSRHDAEALVSTFLQIMRDTWAENRSVCFKGFGAFYIRNSGRRIARNLQTMEDLVLPPGRKLVFKPGKEIRAMVNSLPQCPDEEPEEDI